MTTKNLDEILEYAISRGWAVTFEITWGVDCVVCVWPTPGEDDHEIRQGPVRNALAEEPVAEKGAKL